MITGIKLTLISGVLVIILGMLTACGGSSATIAPGPRAENDSPSSENVFKVDSLAVNPEEVNAGVQALITAKVTNTGIKDNSYVGQVKIIDPNKPSLPAYLYSEQVIIPSGATQTLGVSTTINYPGTYKVIWDKTSRDLIVAQEEAKSPGPSQAAALVLAPDFNAVDVVTGKTIILSQFKGSAVLFNFVNYGCSPSVNQVVSAQLLAIKQLKTQRSDFVPVSVFCGCCSPDTLRQFAKQNNLDWPWILDTDYSIAQKYGSYLKNYGYPTLIFIDQDQIINEVAGSTNLAALTDKLNKISPLGVKK
jgi:peroxiredoxin